MNGRIHYSKRGSTAYVLFDLQPVERRFAPLEDAMALRALLMNYEPVDSERSFILLKAKSAKPASLSLLREGTVRIGAPIDLKDFNAEAVIVYPNQRGSFQLLSDDGTLEIGGVCCKDLPDSQQKRFRSVWITPPRP